MKAIFLGTIAAVAFAGPVWAQSTTVAAAPVETSAGGLDDIIVTAQRRRESVQDVPIAVSAFSAESLESKGITNTLGLIGQIPNMFGSNNTGLGSANAYYIRGLGNTETIATFDPPVGTYVDDIYMSRQNGNNFSFFDVERVEVLRGPQGTLFGRNTTGGAVNVVMKRPGDEVAGFAEVGYGSYDRKMVRGSIDLPMGNVLQLKISGYYNDDDGYVKNTTTGEKLNDSDMAGLRLGVQVKATEKLTWNSSLAYMQNSGENVINFECDPRNPTDCSGRFATTGMVSSRPLGGASLYTLPVTGRKANFPLGNEVKTVLFTSNIEWQGDNHRLSLITGVINMKQDFGLDFADGRGLPNVAVVVPTVRGFRNGGFGILNEGEHRQFTQEVKLNGTFLDERLTYVAGVYFYDENNVTNFADMFTVDVGSPTGFPLLLADRTLRNSTTATAGYVQADFAFTDALTATAGIRYTDEKKTFSIADNRASCLANPLPIGCLNNNLVASNGVAIPLEQTTKIWTPRFALNFKPNDDVLLFASATKGFKSGGWNARGTRRDTLLPFDPEIVWSYEAGVKSEWLDNRLRANLTAFFLDTKALQTPSAFVDPITGGVTFITQNFADYQNKGLELELTAAPVDGLNLYLNVGFQDDKYKVQNTLSPNKYGVKAVLKQQADCKAQLAAGRIPLATGARNTPDCAAGIITSTGDIATPVRTPDWTFAFGGSYDIPLSEAGVILAPSVNFIYRSSLETGTANATIFTGASPPAFDGTVFPNNAFAGDVITGSRTGSHFLVNASLSMRTPDTNWLVSLECENCFDTSYSQSSLVNYNYLNPPRTWLLRARRKF